MFTVSRSPLYDFNTLFHTLDSVNQYQQQQQLLQQQQYEANRPKIVKKVETEDKYQIQIFKRQGNFNSYEVRVLRSGAYASDLINLVIESRRDDFRRVFQFNLNDIEVGDIDWEYYADENVLVLNVPKKVKYCADDYLNSLLASMLGAQVACGPCGQEPKRKHRSHRKEKRSLRNDAEAERAREERARKEAEKARLEAAREEAARVEAAKIEAQRKAEEARRQEKARKEEAARIEKARKEAEKAQKVAEEKARRLAAVRARKEQARQTQEEARREQIQKQQEFLQTLLGGFFPGGVFQAQAAPSPARTESPKKQTPKEQTVEPEVSAEPVSESDFESETESIHSDISTPDSRSSLKRSGEDLSSGVEKLHRHPSLEEVEDEEFVMFRKKFGEQ